MITPRSSGRKKVEEIMLAVSKQQYYTIHQLPLAKLISIEFIEAFVKRGCECCLSFHITLLHSETALEFILVL